MSMRRVLSTPVAAAATSAATCTQQHRGLAYKARTREYDFLMSDVIGMYKHYEKMGVSEQVNKELMDSIVGECAKISEDVLFPLYESIDASGGCVLNKDNSVTTPKGMKEAYKTYVEGGWQGISSAEELGGQGLPSSVGFVQKEMMATANWSFFMYPGLSSGAMATLHKHGSQEQKDTYLTKLVSGEWTGTMCLTEPQCGTDLGLVKTKAVPQEDGTFKLNGTKIFISAGEHDMADNIVHIVLAKLPDAPEGTKGISLFLVPKFIPGKDGKLGTKRNLKCIALEKKMGIKANATAQLAFEDSIGYIIGKPNEGLRQMFTFMNTARIGTAVQGVAHAELAFQNALIYARDRHAMRALSGTKNPEKPADAIINHPGVKGHVLFCKAVAEGGRAFVMDLARLNDLIENAKTPEEAKAFDDELGVLTPIAKGFLTEMGVQAAYEAQQTYGGHGFIQGNGVEQIARDARISTLYEGTTGVQALDLIGRKVLMAKKNNFAKFQAKIGSTAKANAIGTGVIAKCARKLYTANLNMKLATGGVMMNAMKDKEAVGSAAIDFLMYAGYVTLGWYWLRMAVAAQAKINAGEDTDGFYQTKVDMCEFYFSRMLPRAQGHLKISTSVPTFMKMDPAKLDL